MKKISILTPCFNEEGNVYSMFVAVKEIMKDLPNYEYEHIYIDNCSLDNTREILRKIAEEDKHVKLIFNERNFGPNRSGAYGMYQTSGDASICLACDFQDPPKYIPYFIEMWEKGYKVVWGKKTSSKESKVKYFFRTLYYKIIKKLADIKQYEHVTGFGLYDKCVIDLMKNSGEPSPSFRHLVADYGFEVAFFEYEQPKRASGKSSYNFWRYLDTAIEALVNTSNIPIRLASYTGTIIGSLSFLIGLVYLIVKVFFLKNLENIGLAVVVVIICILAGIQLVFLGIIGEYVAEILKRVTNRPMVIECERINFDTEEMNFDRK